MKKLIYLLSAGTLLLAGGTSLKDDALKAGLKPIPTGQALLKIQLEKTKGLVKGHKRMTKEQIALGKKLYFDPRISSSYIISCNTCHNIGLGGADLVPAAIGAKWQKNPHHLNSPTVFNAIFNKTQFWDGRSKDLGNQAQGPIASPFEMAAKPAEVVAKIKSMPGYVSDFANTYGKKTEIDFTLIADTIALFEATLVTPNARFDKFLNGDEKALSKNEKKGLSIFIKKGCISCHRGINLGGSMQPFGVMKPYKFAKVGDFKGNKDGLVKVPTLRNILKTAPYFHNGVYYDVKDAIKEMGAIQLGVKISNSEAKYIAEFFKSLNGDIPKIVYPSLPTTALDTLRPHD